MEMTIFLNRLEELQKQFNRFAKKANAIGLETSLTIGEPYVKELTIYGYDEIAHATIDKGTAHVDVVNVSVVFPDYKLGEYDVIGVIDHTLSTKENAVYPCGDWNIPTKYRKGQGICEHCRTNHKRSKTVLLMNKSGEYKQVGTSCLKEYTGITDISLVSAFRALDALFEESNIDTGMYTGRPSRKIPIEDYLAACVHYVKSNGYTKSLKNEAMDDISHRDLTKSDFEKAKRIRDYFKNGEFTDDFLHNIHMHMMKGYTEEDGLLAYAPIAYAKEMAKAKAKAEKEKANAMIEYYGNVGEKVKGIAVTGKCLTSYTSCYGSIYNAVTTFVYQFTDNANHVFIWKTANDIPLNDDGIFNGVISGTIKEHSEYKGTKQTVLTRVKVIG